MTKETAKGNFLDTLPKAIDKVAQTVGNHLEQNAGSKHWKVESE